MEPLVASLAAQHKFVRIVHVAELALGVAVVLPASKVIMLITRRLNFNVFIVLCQSCISIVLGYLVNILLIVIEVSFLPPSRSTLARVRRALTSSS
jgi:hypothetical protein